jgi:hypothetical protein
MRGAFGSHWVDETKAERMVSVVLTVAKQYGVIERVSNNNSQNTTLCTTLRNMVTSLYIATVTVS